MAVVVTIAFVAQRSLFETPLDAWGDAAVNGLSVMRAEHLQQLVGNYSRVGFHHPGPGFMYLLASGEVLFFHVLGVAPAAYNGQLLGVSVYVAAGVGAVCLVVRRLSGSWGATALGFGIVLLFALRMPLIGQDWFPFLYVPAFLVMVVAGTAVAAGRTVELPLFVLAGGLLAHGHASFLMFVGVTTTAVAAAWWARHHGRVRAELGSHRAAWIATLLVIALLCLPAAADLVLNFPGQWPSYLEFALHSEREPRTWGEIFSFFAASWTGSPLPWPILLVGGVVGLALLLTERDPERRRVALTAWSMLVMQTLLYLYYVARGVDFLSPVELYEYVGYFYRVVPLVVVLVAVVHGWVRFSRPSTAAQASAFLAAAALAVTAVVTSDVSRTVPAGTTYAEAADAIVELDPGRGPVVIRNVTGEVWATGAGIGLALNRIGVNWCITGENAVPIMFEDRTCTRRQVSRGFRVGLTDTGVPPSASVIWQDDPADPRLRPGEIQAYVRG